MSLIEEVASSAVPRFPLGDLCTIKTGQAINKIEISSHPGEYPVINSGREPLGFIDRFNTVNDPIGLTSRGAGVGSVTWCEGRYYRGNLNYSVTIKQPEQIDVRFLYFCLLQSQPDIQALATYDGIPALNKGNLEKLKIPVPPIKLQREIVEILDQFTELQTELEVQLESELEARQVQYAHYRQLLLDEVDAELVALAALGKWQGGMTPSKSNPAYWESGNIPWLASMDVSDSSTDEIRGRVTPLALKKTSLRIVPAPSVAVVMRSNILRRRLPVGLITVETTVNQDLRALIPRDGVDAAYVYQVLRADSERIRTSCVRTDGSMAAVDSKSFFDWQIPLPPLAEQRKIAERLRSFDSIVNDLCSDLPAEQLGRRKQHEYYRDKLLNFGGRTA